MRAHKSLPLEIPLWVLVIGCALYLVGVLVRDVYLLMF